MPWRPCRIMAESVRAVVLPLLTDACDRSGLLLIVVDVVPLPVGTLVRVVTSAGAQSMIIPPRVDPDEAVADALA
jgi:hypothetical protein